MNQYEGGNEVILINKKTYNMLGCDVIITDSTPNIISCETQYVYFKN